MLWIRDSKKQKISDCLPGELDGSSRCPFINPHVCHILRMRANGTQTPGSLKIFLISQVFDNLEGVFNHIYMKKFKNRSQIVCIFRAKTWKNRGEQKHRYKRRAFEEVVVQVMFFSQIDLNRKSTNRFYLSFHT